MNWLQTLPLGLQAVLVLGVFAVLLLAGGKQFTARPAVQLSLGLLGVTLAGLLAVAAPGADALAVIGTCVLAGIALLLLPTAELEFGDHRLDSAALILLGAAGGIALATTTSLLSLVLGLETLSLSVAVLCALGSGSRPLEAAFKFFVLAALSLAVLIYGTGMFAYATGSFELGARPIDGLGFLYNAAVVLLVLGFAFELAVVPVHFGALGAYMAAPPAFAGFAMTANKVGAGLALIRLASKLDPTLVAPVLISVGVASIVWATFAGLAQTDLRGMLGWSAVSHAGFLAIAIGCGAEGRSAAVFYLVVYAASSALVFAALSGRGVAPIPFASLRDQPLSPLRSLALAIGLLSLAGMPPTPGLWAKIGVLVPAWHVAGPVLTSIATLGGVFGALYYLRPLPDLLAAMRRVDGQRARPTAHVAVVVAGAIVVLFTVLPYLGTALAAYAPK